MKNIWKPVHVWDWSLDPPERIQIAGVAVKPDRNWVLVSEQVYQLSALGFTLYPSALHANADIVQHPFTSFQIIIYNQLPSRS
jgi:hypothetical protein